VAIGRTTWLVRHFVGGIAMTDQPFDRSRLVDIVSAYWPARAVLTGQELGLYAALGQGPATAAELAQRIGGDERGTELLANALAGIGLLEKHEGRFANGAFAAEHLVPGHGDYLGGYLEHHLALWQQWTALSEAVRTGQGQRVSRGEFCVRSFIMAMHTNSVAHAEDVVDHVEVTGVQRIIDIGGGSGDYAYAFLRRLPGATATIFDLPDVLPITLECAALAGVTDRVETQPGDYFQDELGEGFDLALISNILHSLNWENCAMLLAKAWRCLRPGGRVVIHDFVLGEDATQPQWASLFSLNMLTAGAAGRSYTHVELRRMLEEAGFGEVEYVPMEGDSEILTGRKSPG
jgi:ubiquinone/menaquinone biosynthesis C-methylase UbiE